MEIFTLLKANIRGKKGSFISIVLLMMIIAMSLAIVLSVKENCKNSQKAMLDETNIGDMAAFIKTERLSDALFQSVENSPLVEKAERYAAIVSDQAESGENSDGNSWYLTKCRSGYQMYNEDVTAYKKKMPSLKKGEIYIPQGVSTKLDCGKGDKIKIFTIGGRYEFKIKGIFIEPLFGSATIGWKQLFISDEDFEEIYLSCKEKETEEMSADFQIVQVYKKAGCTLSDSRFRRELNLATGITDQSSGSMTRELSMHYTNIYSDIILSVLMVFGIFLFVIVLIVMGHSVSTGMEMEYVNLGILKAQGFTKNKIRAVWELQYFLAIFTGTVAGLVIAAPLVQKMGNIFQPLTGFLAGDDISFLKIALVVLLIWLVSGLVIFLITKRMDKISPVRAISGGHNDIYFDSRIKAPICQRGLLGSLALRQLTSCKRRYIGTMAIVSILVFFMMTVTILGNIVDSKSAVEAMGAIYTECDVNFKKVPDDKTFEAMEKVVEKYSPIEKSYYMAGLYCSLNGEEIYCQVYKNPKVIAAIKGRVPLYDNEIAITELIGEELNLKIGDKVIVAGVDKKEEYVISGIFQSINDTGMTFMISLDGAKRIGIHEIVFAGYSLTIPAKAKEAAKALNDSFGDILEAESSAGENIMEDTYVMAINAMKGIIFGFSILFALVVVSMICSKIFLQEKINIGIYKAVGFNTFQLRLQFAIRFFMVSLAGSAVGAVLSLFFSGKMLNSILRMVGITNLAVRYTLPTVIVPAAVISACFFLFAFFVSGKVRRVEVRELIMME